MSDQSNLERFRALRDYVRAMPPSQCSFTVISPSPGTPDYKAIEPDIWISNPYDFYDCMHPLTKTTLPLKQYAKEFASLVHEGTIKTPLRINRHIAPLRDMIRVVYAELNYRRVFRNLYRDYPRNMWHQTPDQPNKHSQAPLNEQQPLKVKVEHAVKERKTAYEVQ